MEVRSKLNFPVHTEEIGLVTAEIYCDDETYHLFLAGDTVRSFIGDYKHFQDCREEISRLQQLAGSDLFRSLVALKPHRVSVSPSPGTPTRSGRPGTHGRISG